jgi:hypothetical protein
MELLTLRIKEVTLGRKHASTISTVQSIGNLYKKQAKLCEAEQMYKRALQGRACALGRKHPSTLSTARKLASIYRNRCYDLHRGMAALRLNKDSALVVTPDYAIPLEALLQLRTRYDVLASSSYLGRVMLWAGHEHEAVVAFQEQSQTSTSLFCDGCQSRLSSATKRFVCKTCKNIDLCVGCYEAYGKRGFLPNSGEGEPCRSHRFIVIPVDDG